MKIRITAMIFSVAMLAVLLTGCACEHEWADATCLAPKTCNLCQETEGEALGHNWAEATCAAPKTCTACGETEGEAFPHTWLDATYQAPKTCMECGTTEGDPLLTLFDELGLKVWENFETSSEIRHFDDGKEFVHAEGHAKNIKNHMYAELTIDNTKEKIRVLVDTDVHITLEENAHLENAADLHMTSFRNAYSKELGKELTDEEWSAICADYKMLSIEIKQENDTVPHFKRLLEAKKQWGYDYTISTDWLRVVDIYTGNRIYPTDANRMYEDVGVLHIEHNGKEMPVLVVQGFQFEQKYTETKLPIPIFSIDMIAFVPQGYNGIVFEWGEATMARTDAEQKQIDAFEASFNEAWRTDHILNKDDLYNYKYYYFVSSDSVK